MLSIAGVVLTGVGFVIAVVLTLWLMFLRISGSGAPVVLEAKSSDTNAEEKPIESIEEEPLQPKQQQQQKSQSRKKNNRRKDKEPNSLTKTPSVASSQSVSFETSSVVESLPESEEEDLLMLARLQGKTVSGLRQRPQVGKSNANGSGNAVLSAPAAPVPAAANAKSSQSATPIATPTKPRKSQGMATTVASAAVPAAAAPASSVAPTSIYSTSPLTAEEVAFIMADLKETSLENGQAVASSSDASSESTSASTSTSASLAMSPTESPIAFVSLQKTTETEWSQVLPKEEEMVRALKGRMAGLQAQLVAAEKAAAQSVRAVEQEQQRIRALETQLRDEKKATTTAKAQLSSLRAVNGELAEKLSHIDASFQSALDVQARQLNQSLDQARARIAELEASQRRSSATSETASEELKTVRSEAAQLRHDLETERVKHRAEHQNSVGAAIALHQEIAQLQGEREALLAAVQKAETRELRALETLQNAEEQFQALATEKSQLAIQLQEAQSRAQNAAVEASFAAPPGLELQMEEVREQLNAAEATISSLQSDLQREMKRAEVAKRVYETKLGELQSPK